MMPHTVKRVGEQNDAAHSKTQIVKKSNVEFWLGVVCKMQPSVKTKERSGKAAYQVLVHGWKRGEKRTLP
jgi:hypothetical protein